jgi:hypothetical protein
MTTSPSSKRRCPLRQTIILLVCTGLPVLAQAQHSGLSDEDSAPVSEGHIGASYRAEWRRQHAASPRKGVSVYTSNETVFVNNARRFGQTPFKAATAADLFDHFQSYTRYRGCIPKFTFAGHGWGREDGGPGLPMGDWGAGLYTDREGFRQEASRRGVWPFRSSTARTLDDLAKLVRRGKVKFCSRCIIQIHSCNIEDAFGESLARISGCQVISSAGQTSPISTRDGSLDHHWISGADGSGTYSGFYRFTPTGDGDIVRRDAIGSRYIAE